MKITNIKTEQGKTFVKFDQDMSHASTISNKGFSMIEQQEKSWYSLTNIGEQGAEINLIDNYTVVALKHITEYIEINR